MSINPFTITFGKEPINIISREHDVETIYQSFLDENPDSEIYILTGIRGSGKTVTMTTLKDKILEHNDWIAVELNPETDMLEQLASKLYDNGKLKKLFISPEFSFSFNGLGFSVKGKDVLTNISSFLDQELKYLKDKKNFVEQGTVEPQISFTLLRNIGDAVVNQTVTDDELDEALEYLFSL